MDRAALNVLLQPFVARVGSTVRERAASAAPVASGYAPFAPPSAEALRLQVQSFKQALRGARTRERDARRLVVEAGREHFFTARVPESAARRIAQSAQTFAAQGELRAAFFTFPSEYCVDGGRAINCADPEWPETLQGLARQYFELFRTVFQPAGYRLGAEVSTWPEGMPGDIEMFLNWATPTPVD